MSGLVGNSLFSKLVYRLNGDAFWVPRVLPGPQTQLQPLFRARIQWVGRQYMMINRCLSPESWLQALREGQGVQMPAYANRLSVPLCIGKNRSAELFWSRLGSHYVLNFWHHYIQRAAPLSFLPFVFTRKRQMGAYLQSGKAGGWEGVIVCSNLNNQQLWKKCAHN